MKPVSSLLLIPDPIPFFDGRNKEWVNHQGSHQFRKISGRQSRLEKGQRIKQTGNQNSQYMFLVKIQYKETYICVVFFLLNQTTASMPCRHLSTKGSHFCGWHQSYFCPILLSLSVVPSLIILIPFIPSSSSQLQDFF